MVLYDMQPEQIQIGFIGQGWIGKHYADEFEERLYRVVRYALEEPYVQNKNQIKDCQVVFIAVPTPTTPTGFQISAVSSALQLLENGTTAVIKSTMIPGTTERLQAEFPDLFVMHSPEFLSEKTVVADTRFPKRNIIGIPLDNTEYRKRAQLVLNLLPNAPFETIMGAKEAELTKYAGNNFLYTKVVFMNALYDLVSAAGANYETVRAAVSADPRIGSSHTQPVHTSGHDQDNKSAVRGAGGHCFIKDFEAMRQQHADLIGKDAAHAMLSALAEYNNQLLVNSNKDLDILTEVYGAAEVEKHAKG
jgi:UDPglucose 6-dehydrogenase